MRSRIVLMLANRSRATEVAKELGITLATVRLWRRRVAELGPKGLLVDAKGRGRKPAVDPTPWENVLATKHAEPKTLRELGLTLGVSASTASRWLRKKQRKER